MEMTVAETEELRDESQAIVAWRSEALERAGFEPQAAYVVATRQDIDLHYAVNLVDRGCPPDLALRILL